MDSSFSIDFLKNLFISLGIYKNALDFTIGKDYPSPIVNHENAKK